MSRASCVLALGVASAVGVIGGVRPILALESSREETNFTYDFPYGDLTVRLLVLEMSAGLNDGETAELIVGAVRAMKGVLHAHADIESKLLQVFSDAGEPVNAARVEAYLELAGYRAKEAPDAKYRAVIESLQTGRAIGELLTENAPVPTTATGVAVTSLAETVEPLRQYFNENKARPRFVAILSST